MSTAGQAFDPANWKSHYAAVRARLTEPRLPIPKITKTHFIVLRRPAQPLMTEAEAHMFYDAYLFALARDAAALERERRSDNREPSLKHLLWETAAKYGMTIPELIAARRDKASVNARHEYMWRAKKETSKSLGQIGEACGGRDHTTVLHGLRVYAERNAQ